MSVESSIGDDDEKTIEYSYDGLTASNESLACSDDAEYLSVELMRKMTPAVLSRLRRRFRTTKEKSFKSDIDRRVEDVMRAAAAEEGIEFATISQPSENERWISEDKFVGAIEDIFGHHKFTTHAQKLFQLLDPFCTGRASWSKLVDRLVAHGARRTRSRADEWKEIENGVVRRVRHCKRETIVKLVDIERADSFCYMIVTRGGRVGVYSGDMKLLLKYEIFHHRTGTQKRVKNCWITDAVYMPDVQVIVFSASDRSLTFYDVTTLTHTPIYCITGMPNVPTCMAYRPSTYSDCGELALGTERGEIIRLRFLRPSVSLFYSNASDRVNFYFWMELSNPPHSAYVSTWRRRVHSRSIRRLIYAKDGEILLSCSHDNKVSMTTISLPGRLEDYVISVQRGVTCFHVVSQLHLLALGSLDGAVRLYDVTARAPHAQLRAGAAVRDVAVLAARHLLLAVYTNCRVNIYDIYEECLLQTIKLKFPFLETLGTKIEFGAYCIHPGPARTSSLILPEAECSRRASSVMTPSGGLALQAMETRDWTNQILEEDPEYKRFARSEIVISCRDYICILPLTFPQDPLKPPPQDSLAARRPSLWDGPKINMTPRTNLPSTPSPRSEVKILETQVKETLNDRQDRDLDLDSLLLKAGLQGLLEKDFVLMQGLKHDLNRKLAEMNTNKTNVSATISAGAPYLALNIYEPSPMTAVNEMTERYARVMRSQCYRNAVWQCGLNASYNETTVKSHIWSPLSY